MKGTNINNLPQALKDCIDYYFKTKHHHHQNNNSQIYQQNPNNQQSSSQEVRIPQMVSEDQFLLRHSLVENLNLAQEEEALETVPGHNSADQDEAFN